MRLLHAAEYAAYGLDETTQSTLARLGDLLMTAGFNVTGLEQPDDIEQRHFLDSLSVLHVPGVAVAQRLADVGSGGGLPALVLALALPRCSVTAVESQMKKCDYIAKAADELSLANVSVVCARAEEYGRSVGRDSQDVVVSRAVAPLPVVAEYSIPLLRLGGVMVAMKGRISDQERIQAAKALAILGADGPEALRLEPFEGALNRWAYVAVKNRPTPENYPRRPGIPGKRPLG